MRSLRIITPRETILVTDMSAVDYQNTRQTIEEVIKHNGAYTLNQTNRSVYLPAEVVKRSVFILEIS